MQPCNCQFAELERITFPLVNQFYKQVYKKGLARKNDRVFVIKDKSIICSAKLKQLDNALLLTGVACAPDYRGKGIASLLINKIRQLQQQPLYCFPYQHLRDFYTQLGFVQIETHLAPDVIRQKFENYSKNNPLLLMVSAINSQESENSASPPSDS